MGRIGSTPGALLGVLRLGRRRRDQFGAETTGKTAEGTEVINRRKNAVGSLLRNEKMEIQRSIEENRGRKTEAQRLGGRKTGRRRSYRGPRRLRREKTHRSQPCSMKNVARSGSTPWALLGVLRLGRRRRTNSEQKPPERRRRDGGHKIGGKMQCGPPEEGEDGEKEWTENKEKEWMGDGDTAEYRGESQEEDGDSRGRKREEDGVTEDPGD
ncbi:hypothetical protein NDU88_003126 [Pleurodeles waltl]|uniref:Uncharacterized protein n=1 Tax=Pleurodeles waltl TaxID=8319 RepID=A0AAV7KUN4_PLEWA|nr:hypothetical protein NDU88_003126 [Pleurodeles waltl]